MTPYYQDDCATIYCGDCRDIVPRLAGVGAMLTDPPYGVAHSSSHGATWENTQIAGDHSTELRDAMWSFYRDLPRAAFGQSWKASAPSDVRGVLIWNKGPAFGMGDLSFPWKPSWEEIYIAGQGWEGKRDEGVLSGPCVVSWESKGRSHPHQKPTWLFSRLIEKLPAVAVFVDPFMGTGPMLEAAKLAGKMAIGIEIEERYCEIAALRLAQEVLAL